MQSLRQLIPSSGALFAFEAAARHSSFTLAGEELGMSQAAVSYSIRKLENHLGTALFLRGHRKVELTDAGERFYSDVSMGLEHIRRSAEELQARTTDRHVTISASTAFASYWMLPRLAQFRADLPEIDLRIQTSEKDIDIGAEGIPLGIRRGRGDWKAYQSALLAPEEVEALASPGYLAANGVPEKPSELSGHKLIHLEEPFRRCPDWREWFASTDTPFPRQAEGLRINDYALVVQAMIEGQGIALGWRHLTDRLVDANVLLRVTGHVMCTGVGYHVVWPKDSRPPQQAERVRDWLVAHGPRRT